MRQIDPSSKQRKIAEKIAQGLQESQELDLIEQVVAFLGEEKTIDFYHETLKIENADGMMTLRGDRRRTPGGVFFTLIKNNLSDIERELLFPKGKLSLPESYIIEKIQHLSTLQLQIGITRIEQKLLKGRLWENDKKRLLLIKGLLIKNIGLRNKLNAVKTVSTPVSEEQRKVDFQEKRARLKINLSTYFSDAELQEVCFDLGIDYENLPRGSKTVLVMELIMRMERQERVPDLIHLCTKLRPKLIW